jgi:uridine kinase
MPHRTDLLAAIARRAAETAPRRIARIAIDGVDGAGKTTFADELADVVRGLGRPVIRASVDRFHNPTQVRYAQGRQSPTGFFEDSYNYTLLKQYLLTPLGPGGDGRYCTAAFDLLSDTAVPFAAQAALPGSILLLDGIFLHRPELRHCWDASIFLRVDFAISVARNAIRDGASPDPLAASNRRYVEGQRIYLSTCAPEAHATMVVDNNDLAAPAIVSPASRTRGAT